MHLWISDTIFFKQNPEIPIKQVLHGAQRGQQPGLGADLCVGDLSSRFARHDKHPHHDLLHPWLLHLHALWGVDALAGILSHNHHDNLILNEKLSDFKKSLSFSFKCHFLIHIYRLEFFNAYLCNGVTEFLFFKLKLVFSWIIYPQTVF